MLEGFLLLFFALFPPYCGVHSFVLCLSTSSGLQHWRGICTKLAYLHTSSPSIHRLSMELLAIWTNASACLITDSTSTLTVCQYHHILSVIGVTLKAFWMYLFAFPLCAIPVRVSSSLASILPHRVSLGRQLCDRSLI